MGTYPVRSAMSGGSQHFLCLSLLSVTVGLVLSSLNAVTKETAIAAMILGRTSPDPGFGSQVELSGSDAGSLLDLLGIGKALPSERTATEEAPPALLQVELTCPSGDEDVMDARMCF